MTEKDIAELAEAIKCIDDKSDKLVSEFEQILTSASEIMQKIYAQGAEKLNAFDGGSNLKVQQCSNVLSQIQMLQINVKNAKAILNPPVMPGDPMLIRA